ncbi:SLC13 family permease [Ligilactobacillus agilis]|uniref:Citrate transporter n=1 Tax=Ligilactobacillus agilis TaxID=1601 RepID=A0A848C301_9LACO|nr:SLC13 family permease [Ligilactobacillus agilis]MCI5761488.1 citrate transporter [Ligilactobacillus agilis]MDY4064136.1 SLC13 family permease [Ligilactobacillus agilis]NME41538.1 citrate transporter [Ligilactobacillus agilis]
MSYVALVGFLMMLVIVYLLIKQKTSTMFSFAVIPIIGALLIGATPSQIGNYLTKGFAMTTSVALIMLFSLPYFMMMDDAGLFNGIVRRILKRVKLSPVVLTVLTLVISIITGFDVSITSIYLITIPLLLPFYKKLKMSPMILMFLTTLGVINTMDVPWSARMLRSASLIPNIQGGAMHLFKMIFPAQIIFTVILFLVAIWLGIRESKRIKKEAEVTGETIEVGKVDVTEIKDDPEIGRPQLFWVNVILTLLVIAGLIVFPTMPSYYVFAVGLVIALAINYPDLKQQNKLLKKYAASLFPVMPAILLSGVVVGVMEYSGMMKAMVDTLVAIIPASFGPWVYIIVAIFGVPLMFLFTNDTWYYVLLPIVISLMKAYHVPADVVIITLFFNMGAMLTPIAQPQLYIGIDLTDGAISFEQYVKFAFFPVWILSLVLLGIGLLTGAFR